MPVINLTVLQDVLGSTEPVDAVITATVNRASIDAYRIDNQFIIFPRDIKINVTAGTPDVPFVLTVLPASYYWHIDIFVNGEAPVRRTVILPGSVGPYDFDELVDVVPETALPDQNAQYAASYLAQIQASSPYVSASVPTTSIGQAGDVAGLVADSGTHHYYCTGTYNGTTNIWKRVAWASDTW